MLILILRDGAVLFLEESRALAEPEFVRSVYEVGLLSIFFLHRNPNRCPLAIFRRFPRRAK